MTKYSDTEQHAIMTRVNTSTLCGGAKWILEVACGSFISKCSCGGGLLNKDGEIAYIFHGNSEIKDREAKERVEQDINGSGIATVSFRKMPQKPGKYHVGYYVTVDFLPGALSFP